MFHKLSFTCSRLVVIFLLLSQEAEAKNDQSGLVLLSRSSYTPGPATQHLLQNMTHRTGPGKYKIPSDKSVLFGI